MNNYQLEKIMQDKDLLFQKSRLAYIQKLECQRLESFLTISNCSTLKKENNFVDVSLKVLFPKDNI